MSSEPERPRPGAGLRVLVVHNEYRSALPSGENVVVETEVSSLRAAGVDVTTYVRSSDEIGAMSLSKRAAAAISPITGASSRSQLQTILEQTRPDVVHLHNPYPLISPRLISWCTDAEVPLVATIHNFRLRCMNGLLFRDDEICTRCEDTNLPWPGVLHGCYRDSRAQSAMMAAALTAHRSSWRFVTTFIAVSEFVADRLVTWGIDPERVVIKSNPVDDPGPPCKPGHGYLYAGRLVEAKGIPLLLDAWRLSGLEDRERLLIAGDGPLAGLVRSRAAVSSGIEYLGHLTPAGVAQQRKATAVGVLCSRSFETHSAAPESFAHGRAILATNIGALGRVVDKSVGWLADPTVEGLARGLVEATDRHEIARRGDAARRRFETTYRAPVVIDRLMEIFRQAIAKG